MEWVLSKSLSKKRRSCNISSSKSIMPREAVALIHPRLTTLSPSETLAGKILVDLMALEVRFTKKVLQIHLDHLEFKFLILIRIHKIWIKFKVKKNLKIVISRHLSS
jgi:hypothetical protein